MEGAVRSVPRGRASLGAGLTCGWTVHRIGVAQLSPSHHVSPHISVSGACGHCPSWTLTGCSSGFPGRKPLPSSLPDLTARCRPLGDLVHQPEDRVGSWDLSSLCLSSFSLRSHLDGKFFSSAIGRVQGRQPPSWWCRTCPWGEPAELREAPELGWLEAESTSIRALIPCIPPRTHLPQGALC